VEAARSALADPAVAADSWPSDVGQHYHTAPNWPSESPDVWPAEPVRGRLDRLEPGMPACWIEVDLDAVADNVRALCRCEPRAGVTASPAQAWHGARRPSPTPPLALARRRRRGARRRHSARRASVADPTGGRRDFADEIALDITPSISLWSSECSGALRSAPDASTVFRSKSTRAIAGVPPTRLPIVRSLPSLPTSD
jgi:hypothetical protein